MTKILKIHVLGDTFKFCRKSNFSDVKIQNNKVLINPLTLDMVQRKSRRTVQEQGEKKEQDTPNSMKESALARKQELCRSILFS